MSLGNLLRGLIPQGVYNDLFWLSSARVSDDLKHRYAAGLSMWWSLENLKRCGFCPANVIDVGACLGEWIEQTRAIWPEAKYLMVEPQPNRHERLRRMCNESVAFEPALLGSAPSNAVTFQMDDLGGSSVLEQVQDNLTLTATLPMKTLDSTLLGRLRFGETSALCSWSRNRLYVRSPASLCRELVAVVTFIAWVRRNSKVNLRR